MLTIPAIDIIDGKCVRLCKGDYARMTVYSDCPADVAMQFQDLGATRLHLVDLDGAAADRSRNLKVLEEIADRTQLKVDFGGGIRTRADLDRAFSAGAAMATVGSVAASAPETVAEWIRELGADRIIIGADVRDGRISVHGWKEDSKLDLFDFLTMHTAAGATQFLCTDISRDGMLSGASESLYRSILEKFPDMYLIASGGVSSIEDLQSLSRAGLPAAILGKAWYEGRVTARQLQDFIEGE